MFLWNFIVSTIKMMSRIHSNLFLMLTRETKSTFVHLKQQRKWWWKQMYQLNFSRISSDRLNEIVFISSSKCSTRNFRSNVCSHRRMTISSSSSSLTFCFFFFLRRSIFYRPFYALVVLILVLKLARVNNTATVASIRVIFFSFSSSPVCVAVMRIHMIFKMWQK